MDWGKFWQDLQSWVTNTGIKIVIALVVLIVSFLLINWLCKSIAKRGKKLQEQKHFDKTLYRTLSHVLSITLKILVVIGLVGYLGLDTSGVTALIASLGVGVGLAVNGTLSNLAGGFLLLVTRPFKVDDYIAANGYEGTVEDIFICYTKIRTVDCKVVYLPNGALSTTQIVNYTEKGKRRLDVTFGVSYDDDFEKAKSLIAEVVAANDKIHTDPAPNIRVTAQSAKTMMPFSPYCLLGINMMNAPDTTLMPGAVLMICRAGRSTFPVVFWAPAISPSASPLLIMRQAR